MSSSLRFTFLVAVLSSFAAFPAQADTLKVSFSDLTFTGRPGTPEVISGSFLWNTSTNTLYDSVLQTTGPIPLNGAVVTTGFNSSGNLVLVDFNGGPGVQFQIDSLDFSFINNGTPPAPGTYTQYFFLNCGSARACGYPGPVILGSDQISGPITVSNIPEPSSLAMLLAGATLLFFLWKSRRRNLPIAAHTTAPLG